AGIRRQCAALLSHGHPVHQAALQKITEQRGGGEAEGAEIVDMVELPLLVDDQHGVVSELGKWVIARAEGEHEDVYRWRACARRCGGRSARAEHDTEHRQKFGDEQALEWDAFHEREQRGTLAKASPSPGNLTCRVA